jgi:hypothetical protein
VKKPRKVPDERWVAALDAFDHGDLRELVRALLDVASVPDWVRKELAGEAWDEPPLSDSDRKLLRARNAYDTEPRPWGEKKNERIARIADQHGVPPTALGNLIDGRGRAATRLRHR